MKRVAVAIHYHISSHLFPRITKSDLARKAPEAIRRQMIADPELQVRRALEPKVSRQHNGDPAARKKKKKRFIFDRRPMWTGRRQCSRKAIRGDPCDLDRPHFGQNGLANCRLSVFNNICDVWLMDFWSPLSLSSFLPRLMELPMFISEMSVVGEKYFFPVLSFLYCFICFSKYTISRADEYSLSSYLCILITLDWI
ncbi:hypothetical protein CDAR_64981 [Caerostris darwini]|uniref:Uncharacterized protein n=1 Tax=Caerostris darwini TaxID=1538125 RepID=A0AAV4W0H1_9ARAC|nr:hypothetical protein CDAR_64981 [Caerostris darwini]